jgi:4a-hydroxytetrahydrobiopterin dehydratase
MSSNEEIERANEESGSGWELKEGKIMKSFEFPGFIKAIEFVNDLAKIAEKVNHHPTDNSGQ